MICLFKMFRDFSEYVVNLPHYSLKMRASRYQVPFFEDRKVHTQSDVLTVNEVTVTGVLLSFVFKY